MSDLTKRAAADVETVSTENADLLRLENDMLESASVAVFGASLYCDVPVGDATQKTDMNTPPDEWIEKYGSKAVALWRSANYALLPRAEAPAGLEVAAKVMVGIMRNKSNRNAPVALNVIQIALPQMEPIQYEVIDVTPEQKLI